MKAWTQYSAFMGAIRTQLGLRDVFFKFTKHTLPAALDE